MAVAPSPSSAADPPPAAARRSPAGARPGLAVLAVLLLACGYAAFASGAVDVPDAVWMELGVAAAALTALAAWATGPRAPDAAVSLAAPRAAWLGAGAIALLALWAALSIAWGARPDAAWDVANREIAYALCVAAAIAAGASAPRALPRAAGGVALVSTLVALWALAGAIAPGIWDDAAREARLRAPFSEFADLALLCALAAPVALRLGASGTARASLRLAALAAALILVVALALTWSRAGAAVLLAGLLVSAVAGGSRLRLLAAAAAVAAAATAPVAFAFSSDPLTTGGAPLSERTDDGRVLGLVLLGALVVLCGAGWAALRAEPRLLARFSARRATAAGLVVVALALAAAVAGVLALALSDRGFAGSIGHAADTLTEREPAPRRGDPGRLVATDAGGRRLLWDEALGAASDEPVDGWGAGSWPVIHGLFRAGDVPARDARSSALQALAERGAIGVALLALAVALLLGAVIARLRAVPPGAGRDLEAAALGAGVAWVLGALVVSSWEVPGVTLPVLVLLGVAAARPGVRVHAPAWGDPHPGAGGWRWGALAAGGLALALVATSALLPAWSRARADDALRVAVDPRATEEDLSAAAADARLSSKLDPPAVRPNLVAAMVAQRRGRLLEGRGELLEAVEEQPKSAQAWAALATLALDLADRDGALAAAGRALALDPHDRELLALAQRAETAQAPPAASPTATGTPLPTFVVP
jgi:hypothetical protein